MNSYQMLIENLSVCEFPLTFFTRSAHHALSCQYMLSAINSVIITGGRRGNGSGGSGDRGNGGQGGSEHKRFLCDYCPAAFTRIFNLRKHVKVKHPLIHEYNCSKCGKKFPSRTIYLDHCLICTKCRCNICHKVFQCEKSLSFHAISHTTGEQEKYMCFYCGSTFDTVDALHIHRGAMHGAMHGEGDAMHGEL